MLGNAFRRNARRCWPCCCMGKPQVPHHLEGHPAKVKLCTPPPTPAYPPS